MTLAELFVDDNGDEELIRDLNDILTDDGDDGFDFWVVAVLRGPVEFIVSSAQNRPVIDIYPIYPFQRFAWVHPFLWQSEGADKSGKVFSFATVYLHSTL